MIKWNCGSCSGTGIYKGLCEGPGQGVVCLTCKGAGAVDNKPSYNPKEFTGLVRRSDIQRVYRGNGTFIFGGAGPRGNGVSYQEFFEGKLPE